MKNKQNLNSACACHIYSINNITFFLLYYVLSVYFYIVFKGVKSPI